MKFNKLKLRPHFPRVLNKMLGIKKNRVTIIKTKNDKILILKRREHFSSKKSESFCGESGISRKELN